MKDELLDRLSSLVDDAVREGYLQFAIALARVGAAAAMNLEREAGELLADLSQRAADEAAAVSNAGPGSANHLQ